MNANQTVTKNAVDPVCRMEIDPAKAVASSTFNGETYYFCSRGCERKFAAAPDAYVDTVASQAAASSSCCSTGHSCC